MPREVVVLLIRLYRTDELMLMELIADMNIVASYTCC